MKWDDVTLVILAVFGCVTLVLTQISEVLSKLPQIIRAWRQVRHELSGGADPGSRHPSGSTAPDTPAVDPSGGVRASGGSEAGPRDEG